jgi:flagellar biosynthesis anti-sigma factor FlgM
MKIDPTIQFPSDPQSDRVPANAPGKATTPQRSASSSGTSSASGEDTFSRSSTHDVVQSLTASLANVPEVRTQLVTALQQRVNSGTYQPASQKVAAAILADQAGRKQ